MNNRAISLPDLAAEKKRNTAASLSEGFAGSHHKGALATNVPWPGRPGLSKRAYDGSKEAWPNSLGRVLPLYYRCRQLILTTEKRGRRVPQKLHTDARALEKVVAKEIRNIHPLLFQRMDDRQLDRFLRTMTFLRLSIGRWIFGSEVLKAEWPRTEQMRCFMLLTGRVNIYRDGNGVGEFLELLPGSIFGEQPFRMGDEQINDAVGGAAHCEEPSIVGMLTTDVLEAAFADRIYGNPRIAQKIRHSPALQRAVLPEPDPAKPKVELEHLSAQEKAEVFETISSAVRSGLDEMAKLVAVLHLMPGEPIFTTDSLDESVFYIEEGRVEVKADVTLIEKPESRTPKRTRIHIMLERAEKLAGNSIFDKLDPYVIVKLGEYKRFQTPVQWNTGVNPFFNYDGTLTFNGEEEVTFTVMDYDKFTSDSLCGSCTIPVHTLTDGYNGKADLYRPKSSVNMMSSTDSDLMEKAGKLFFSVKWDYEAFNPLIPPKTKTWPDQVLFNLFQDSIWGHERLMLQNVFMRALQGAASSTKYRLELANFSIRAAELKGTEDRCVVMKIANDRFIDFIKKSQREKAFLQACRLQALDKQQIVKGLIMDLLQRWSIEEQNEQLRRGLLGDAPVEEAVDPNKFRSMYNGVKAHIRIRNATNLTSGGWFDKLDPYTIVRFRGSKEEVRTSVLADSGSDPIWDCEGSMTYHGEVALEISVWDFDRYSADSLLATGVVQVEQFCSGFDGMIPLSIAGNKRKRAKKQAMITIGILFDRPPDAILDQDAKENTLGRTS
ncbi:unnamed protein product [Cladocopium goreaui]|uniref:C2 domain-containing protein n=2 Tax=Cladocopium goreaui TaxID=2562237 RepID=A0A9P1BUG5_9DINO|nr:unnamed protein product [Cladocopium goreaui]|mmetsp:Transcript_1179/g.2637  ORF Transcript_1179/g.2637 Transcript_1179/m.2637 type:complete len:776 (-) Transcript_1179:64-2391(-)